MATIPKAKIEVLHAALAAHAEWSAPGYPTPMSDAVSVQGDLSEASADVVPALLSEREEMLALLREVEWGRAPFTLCPVCEAMREDAFDRWEALIRRDGLSPDPKVRRGHTPACRLAAFLRDA